MDASGIRYNQVECKSLLNKSGLSDYAVNCYSGCGHACVYCYARFATRFSHPREEWGSFVDIKTNAPQVLAREVKRKTVGQVMLSSVCDAWQPAESNCLLTRQCLEILLRYQYRVSLLTKNALAGRDLDLLASGNTEFGVTVTTLDPKLAGIIEPRASAPQERLELLQSAKSKGIRTYAFIGPLLPFLSDNEQNITALLKAVKGAGVDYFYVDKLNLRYGVWPALLKLLHEHYPDLIPEYRKIFFENVAKAAYSTNLTLSVNAIARKLGMDDKMNLIL
jgi:DNA repair photolyase